MLRSRWIHTAVMVTLLATPLFLFGDRALAIQDSEDKVLFGPFGIATGQCALVNVYAIGNPDEIGNPDKTPWNFVVRLFDRRGTLVQERPLRLPQASSGPSSLLLRIRISRLRFPRAGARFAWRSSGSTRSPTPR
jgi:hypothetical protein